MIEHFRRLFLTRAPSLFLVSLVVAACSDDPTGPNALSVLTVGVSADSIWVGAPGEPIPTGVSIRIKNSNTGQPVAGAAVTWEAVGRNALALGSAQSDAKGLATGVWQLGTDASELQKLRVFVRSGQQNRELVLRARAVPHVVSALHVALDTPAVVRLGDSLMLAVDAIDPYGNVFPASDIALSVSDSAIGTTAGPWFVGGPHRGSSHIWVTSHGIKMAVPVRVMQYVAAIVPTSDTIRFSALGAQRQVAYVVEDDRGRPVADTTAALTVADIGVAQLTAEYVQAIAPGLTTLRLALGPAAATVQVSVAQVVHALETPFDTLRFDALSATRPIGVVPVDSLGAPVQSATLSYDVADEGIAVAGPDGQVRAVANGVTTVVVSAQAETTHVTIKVAQRPTRVAVAQDPVILTAIGDTAVIMATAVDSLGFPVPGAVTISSVSDPNILEVVGPDSVRARAAGAALVSFTVADLLSQATVEVTPVAATIEAAVASQDAILSVALDSLIPIRCLVRDRNGNVIDTMPTVMPSAGSRWTGQACGGLWAQRSGFDTVRVRAGGIEADVPIVLAIRPMASSRTGDELQLDSLPAGTFQWAPTARRNSHGEFEIYFAAYPKNAWSWSALVADLHRLVSSDGMHWRYDGVALQHNDSPCTLDGNGIENVSIVPRAEGEGWRMFFAAGGFNCYGWQVLSAVSTDERTWVKEPGVRLSNGGVTPPDSPSPVPWPVGEGMETERLPSGEWRMIVGGYEHIQPREDKFQIVEWHSTDQLTWSYVGPMVTTRDMPPAAQGTIYSPNIRQIAPGLWRLIFNGDDRSKPNWRGRIWSAVSTDQRTWQLEGELMGDPQERLWYGSLVDDLLVLARGNGDQRRLAIARVVMP